METNPTNRGARNFSFPDISGRGMQSYSSVECIFKYQVTAYEFRSAHRAVFPPEELPPLQCCPPKS